MDSKDPSETLVDAAEASEIFVVYSSVVEKHVKEGDLPAKEIHTESGIVHRVAAKHLAERFYLRTQPPDTTQVETGVTRRDIWLALISGGIGGIAGALSTEAIDLMKWVVNAIVTNLPMFFRCIARFDMAASVALRNAAERDSKENIAAGQSVEELILQHDTYLAAVHQGNGKSPNTIKRLLDIGCTKDQFIAHIARKP